MNVDVDVDVDGIRASDGINREWHLMHPSMEG
jgi:hypothetical protein